MNPVYSVQIHVIYIWKHKSCETFYYFIFTFMTAEDNLIAQDWPNLNKYRSENKQVADSIKNDPKIVFMGDSITELWSILQPGFFQNRSYINRGISGQTTPQMLIRFRQDVVHLNPKIVHILAGINDIAGNTGPSTLGMIEDNIFSMCEIARSNEITVILCSVLPAAEFPWNPDIQPADKVIMLNNRLKEYAELNNIIFLDYYKAMVDANKGLPKELSEDGVHPNKKGYEIMAPLADRVIKKVLES
jgi:lysophospholipase L1-like esterase